MKRTIATIGWLMCASASFGSDGQHTGVGGNPVIPPPNPSGIVLPPWSMQMLIHPGLVVVQPEFDPQDASNNQEASSNENKSQDAKAGESSAK